MKSKQIAAFFVSRRRYSGASAVLIGKLAFPANVVYVRAQLVDAASLEDALDKARPRRGETLMNTHYVPVAAKKAKRKR